MSTAERQRTRYCADATSRDANARRPTVTPEVLVARRAPFLRAALRCASAMLRFLGPARYALADSVGAVAYLLMPGRRRWAVANHRRLDPAVDRCTARRRARTSFRGFARTVLDFVWACGMGPDDARRHGTVVRGLDTCLGLVAEGRGAVVALTHFGNWDMAANVGASVGVPVTTVMARVGPVTDLVVWARRRNRLEVFLPNGTRARLADALRRGRFVALLCDVTHAGATVDVRYCGGPVAFSTTPAVLAVEADTPLLPVACWRADGTHHLAVYDDVRRDAGDTVAVLMQRVASTLEPVVREHPGQWYPFRPVHVAAAAGAPRRTPSS